MVTQKLFFEVTTSRNHFSYGACHESTLSCWEEVNPGHMGNNIIFFIKYYVVKQ